MKRLVVLRPEPAAGRTVERARAMGLDAVAVPLFRLEPLEWVPPDESAFDALLLTSANAVNLGGEQLQRLRNLPVHAVGQATAVAAEVAGFGLASVGEAGIDALLDRVAPETRLLHLCGADRREPQAPRQRITCVPVYRAAEIPGAPLPDQLPGAVAMLHSPRAARRLAELVRGADRQTVTLAAISEAAVDAAGSGWAEVRAARAPSDGALLALAARLCET